jgi:glycosyltransferase involved in cell wall biosynthesis
VPAREVINGIEVSHPRFLSGPGYFLHRFDSTLWLLSLRSHFDQLRREFPFDLIHAHFSYPDGVVAAEIARRYGVPFIITEHARWRPWMDRYPSVRRKAVRASRSAAFHTGVSRFVVDLIREYTGESERLGVSHLGVDGSVFDLPRPAEKRDLQRILYVGRLHLVKGVDVLLRAMALLVKRRPMLRLTLVGGNFLYGRTSREADYMRQLACDLGLEEHVEFNEPKSSSEVAGLMRQSAVLVLPSRSETFGTVLVEALACGTPVVATECGGPADIVTQAVGRLVPKENPEALADAIQEVVDNLEKYSPERLRDYALKNFSWESLAEKTLDLYQQATGVSPVTEISKLAHAAK